MPERKRMPEKKTPERKTPERTAERTLEKDS